MAEDGDITSSIIIRDQIPRLFALNLIKRFLFLLLNFYDNQTPIRVRKEGRRVDGVHTGGLKVVSYRLLLNYCLLIILS